MKKTVLTFGLISGGILSAMMLLTMPYMHSIGYDQALVIGYTTMVLAFLLVYFGVRSYRDNVAGGTIRFGRALAVGSMIALIASLCYVATWELLFFEISPDYATEFRRTAIERAQASGGTPAEVRAKVAEAEHFSDLYQNPAINAAMTFVEPLPVGLVMALVSAGVLSRRRRGSESGLAAAVA